MARGEWARHRGRFVPWRQENCLVEEAKTDPKGFNILSRPPLAQAYTRGTGPLQGIYQRPGLFNGDTFTVSGGHLFRAGADLGAIDGTGPVIWASGNSELVVTRGASAWSYNGTNLAAIAFPDGAQVRSVHWMARLFVFARKGSGRWYWSATDDARTIDGLDFANAESEPDELYDIAKMGDAFALLGANSIETWVLNGDADLPWTRVSQRTFGRGVRDTGCKAEIADANSFYFISSDNMVCRMDAAPVRISDSALDEKIAASATASAFWWQYDGRPYFAVRLTGVTYVMELANDNQPVLFSTQGRSNWAPMCAANIGGVPLFGDDTGPQVWEFDPDSLTDCGNVEMPRYFTLGWPGEVGISNVIVSGDNGTAQTLTGEQAAPILEMRYSRDYGRTFTQWRGSEWGRMGQYRKRARFGSCGQFGEPGFLAECRMLACAPMRIDRAQANVSASGRGR